MINSVRFTAVLDTNIIYPVLIRDLLFWFAYFDLYTPAWSNHISEEFIEVCKRKNPILTEEKIRQRINKANEAFPFALVENYEPIIETLELKDPKDRHVLAAAIKINANLIVTNNLKDFPMDYLSKFNIGVKSADEFICDIIDLDHKTSLEAFRQMVLAKINPNLDEFEVLDAMRKNGLKESANYIHSLL